MVGDGGDGGDDTDDDDGDKNEDKDGNGNYCNGWVPYYVGIFARPTPSWWLQMAWRQIGAGSLLRWDIRETYAIMMVADGLAPNRRHAISNHNVVSSATTNYDNSHN